MVTTTESAVIQAPATVRDIGKAVQWQWWPIGRVQPYERNARNHDAKQVGQIATSIKEFGWRHPILVDKAGIIIAGHGRLSAAQYLRLSVVPVVVADDLSEEQVRKLRIADNKIASNSTWNDQLLSLEIADLAELNVDMSVLGFDQSELDKLVADAIGAFNPTLDPSKADGAVTDADVDKANDALNGRPGDAASQNIVDLTCPHCNQSFGVDRDALV